jgi:hypothetical protein
MSRPRRVPPLSVAPTVLVHEPDLAPEHKAAILEALRWAWLELRRGDPSLLLTGDEERITERMQALLNKRRAVSVWSRGSTSSRR